MQPDFILSISDIEHFYHQGWDCVCSVSELPSGRFKAAVKCRSLMNGQMNELREILYFHGDYGLALAHARQLAVTWAKNNKHLT